MTNLKDLAPENRPLFPADSEARAIIDKFEALFSEAAPPSMPRERKAGRDEFAIEFPVDDSPVGHAAAPPCALPGREPVPTPAEASAKDRRQDAPGPEPFERPGTAASAGSGETLPAKHASSFPSDFPRTAHARRRSTAIVAGIATALLIGIGAGYFAGKRSDGAPTAPQGDASPGVGPTLRFDYDLVQPPKSGKRRNLAP